MDRKQHCCCFVIPIDKHKMRTLVIGDIHELTHYTKSWKEPKLQKTPDFLGYVMAGVNLTGPWLLNWIEYYKQLRLYPRHHDELLLHWLKTAKDNLMWYKHGGEATVLAYEKVDATTTCWLLLSLKDYYLDKKSLPFVHGFTNMNGVAYEFFPKLFYWDRTCGKLPVIRPKYQTQRFALSETIDSVWRNLYRPHPVTRIGKTEPVQMACVWNRYRSCFKGPLTILDK
jgi:serine/threonine protein phosphatase 1